MPNTHFTHNERLTLRRIWPQGDWPEELEHEHARRSQVNHQFMGLGKGLNNQQLFDLILLFVDHDGQPMRRPGAQQRDSGKTPIEAGFMQVPHFGDDEALANDAEHTVSDEPPKEGKKKAGSKQRSQALATAEA